ncbi:MAG TPA: hypothetical protein VIB55_07275 [Longimicrobium sp.]
MAALTAFLCGCSSNTVTEVGYAARVRVQARQLGPGWHAATVGRVGGTCMTVMVGDPPEAPVRVDVVDFGDVAEMLVSDRFDGLPGPDGTPRKWAPGADTTREEWRKVELGPMREKHGNCSRG